MLQSHGQRERSWSPSPSSSSRDALHQKAEEINLVLLQPDVDLWRLRELALGEGGLVNDTLRKRAWPKLVGLHKYYGFKPSFYKPKPQVSNLSPVADDRERFEIDTSAMPGRRGGGGSGGGGGEDDDPFSHLVAESMDAGQIQKDVARCTWHLLTGTQRSRRVQHRNKSRKKASSILRKKQRRLENLINLTLVESYELAPSVEDRLRYYQGYHDVACIFLHALGGGNTKPDKNPDDDKLGLELPARVLCQVSYSHFRDHLRSNFLSLQTALKVALFPLLAKLDRAVHNHLVDCDMEPFFCLSWVLTWFAHDVRDTELAKRLFDAFLCSHPLFPLYVALAMITDPINRQSILSTDCDFAAVHQALVALPRNSCRVGWKKRDDGFGGGGYVSDDDDDATARTGDCDGSLLVDDATASTGPVSTYFDNETVERSMSLATSSTIGQSGNFSTDTSLQSFSVGPIAVEESRVRVPFEDLIERGIAYMRRFPPRCLLGMARRYHREEWTIGKQVSNISLLQNPPTWSLASTAKADWVLKQRVRQELGLKATSRRDRKKKNRYMQRLESASEKDATAKLPVEAATPLVDTEYLRTHRNELSVIAVGYGPDPVNSKRKKRRKQMKAAIAVAAAAMLVAVAYRQYKSSRSSSAPESDASLVGDLSSFDPVDSHPVLDDVADPVLDAPPGASSGSALAEEAATFSPPAEAGEGPAANASCVEVVEAPLPEPEGLLSDSSTVEARPVDAVEERAAPDSPAVSLTHAVAASAASGPSFSDDDPEDESRIEAKPKRDRPLALMNPRTFSMLKNTTGKVGRILRQLQLRFWRNLRRGISTWKTILERNFMQKH